MSDFFRDRWEQLTDLYFRAKNSILRGYAVGQTRSGMMPKVKVVTTHGTEYEDLDVLTPPGVVTNPGVGEGTEFLILSPNGDLSHAVAIPIGDRKNFKKLTKEGLALHHPKNKEVYVVMNDSGIVFHAPGETKGRINLDGTMQFDSIFKVLGEIRLKGDFIIEGTIRYEETGIRPLDIAES